MTTFGEVLRRARLAAGLTQRQLAERVGLSRAAVWRLEAGRSRPTRDTTIGQLSNVLPELGRVDHATLDPPGPTSGKGGT
jgi:transcriptional regulator with XRE-family HTH domain